MCPLDNFTVLPSSPAADRSQPYRRTLQLLQQLPCVILVNSILYQCLRHIRQSRAVPFSGPPTAAAYIARACAAQCLPAPDACSTGLYPSSPVLCIAVHSCGTSGTADSSHTALQRSGPATLCFDLDRQPWFLPSLIPFTFTTFSDHRITRSRRSPDSPPLPRWPQLGFQST